MQYKKTIIYSLIASSLTFISCENSSLDGINEESLKEENIILNSEELSKDDLNGAINNLTITYPIVVFEDNDSELVIKTTKELSDYNGRIDRCKIKFPIEITIDNEMITINGPRDLRQYLPKKEGDRDETKKGERPGLPHVYPFTVIKSDDSELVINSVDEIEAYVKEIGPGNKPKFKFPIYLKDKAGNEIKMENESDIDKFNKQNRP